MRGYEGKVSHSIARIVIMLAVMLMPFGMAPAAAVSAQPSMAPGMAMRHCPDPAPAHKARAGFAACTMACAGALPAFDLVRAVPILVQDIAMAAVATDGLDGLHPETATPPPKLG